MYLTDLRPIGFDAFHFIFCVCVAYISFDYRQCMTTHVFYLFYYLFFNSLDYRFGFCRAKVLTYLRRQKMKQLLLSEAGRYLAFIEISMFFYQRTHAGSIQMKA